MSPVTALPDRPLSAAAVAAPNRADGMELAVAVDDDPADGVFLAADARVTGLRFAGGAWRVVESVPLDGDGERYDALRRCEPTGSNPDASPALPPRPR